MTKLFLSYARADDRDPNASFDPATSFVARLHGELTARGFDVWFDRVSMPSRNLTFHQEIRDAVSACDRLVLVVGPKAATSDYVRQEWQFAYFEADKVVTPILRQGDFPIVPDELKLLHCEDFRDDAQYGFHLDRLAQILSDPPPPLGKLIAVPSLPPHFLSRTDRLVALRDALRADLDRPVVITGAAAHVGVHGMGGIGKSVLACALAHDRKIREAFPDGIVWVGLGPLPSLPALMRRVHRDLGGDGAIETEHEGKTKLKELLSDKAVLLIIDDVWRRADVDAFNVLGPKCRALITTRDAGLLTSLGGTHHVVELLTNDEALSLLAQGAGVESSALPPEAAAIVAECGRLPLAVALCGSLIRRGLGWRGVLEQLRQARIDRIADRHAVEMQHQSVWHAIHISVEFLPPDQKQRFLELAVFPPDESTPAAAVRTLWAHTAAFDDWASDELLVSLAERSLVQLTTLKTRTGEASRRGVSLHDLVHDYVRLAAGDSRAPHEQLLAAYQAKCPNGWWTGPNDGYFFTHLRDHLIAAGRVSELADLLHELRWLEAKNAAGLVFDLTADFRVAIESLPEQDQRRKRLRLLDEAFRRDIHFIARHALDYPQGLFQCLWNHAWWYDCPDAGRHYENGHAPGASAEVDLCRLLERWREDREHSSAGFPWLRSLRPPPMHLGSAQLAVLRGHGDRVTSVAFSPDGDRIVSGSEDEAVRVWDSRNGAELAVSRGHESWVNSVAVFPDGWRIVSGSRDGTARLWDAHSGAELAVLRGHEDRVDSVAVSPDGRCVVSGSRDNTVRVWDARSGVGLAVLGGHGHYVGSVAFSPDGGRLASGSWDETVRVWDTQTWAELTTLRCGDDVRSVAYSPDGQRIASGCRDCRVELWDAQAALKVAELHGHQRPVASVAFSPDGRQLASGSWDKTVRLWDAHTGVELAVLRGHEGAVYSVAFSPDGRRIASGSQDETVRVWDAQPGSRLVALPGHEWNILCLAYSPDGRRVVSGSADTTVRIWDADLGVELSVLRGHQDSVVGLAYCKGGSQIVSGSSDWIVGYWDSHTGRLLEVDSSACGTLLALGGQMRASHFIKRFGSATAGSTGHAGPGLRALRQPSDDGYVERASEAASTGPEARPSHQSMTDGARASLCDREVVVESASGGQQVAWFPGPLQSLIAHPSGRAWAGAAGSYLCLITLEGGDT